MTQKCCEKCKHIVKDKEQHYKDYPECNPCHTQSTNQDWEKEVKRLSTEWLDGDMVEPENIIYFIEDLLYKKELEVKQEIREVVKGMKIKDSEHKCLSANSGIAPTGKEYEWGYRRGKQIGYNQAIKDILEKI